MTPQFNEVMSFLAQIETSFQEAEKFLQESNDVLCQKGYGVGLDETIEHIQQAKEYVSTLRIKLPTKLDEQEDEIIAALMSARNS